MLAKLRAVSLKGMLAFGLLLAPASAAWAEQVSDFIKIQTFKTHSRVSLRLDSSVEVVRQKTDTEESKGFEVLLQGLSLSDLGAPFGSEGEWLQQLEAVSQKDPRIEKLQLRELESGVLVKASWKFPGGKAALARPAMETFHYRKDLNYVVDFWVKPGPTIAQAQAAEDRKKREQTLKQAEASVRARRDRRDAVNKIRSEMEDSLRFCRDAWTENREVFLQFLPVKGPFSFEKYLPHRTADQDYPYPSPQGDSEEAKYFRLALKLYKKEKYALVQKTLDFFDRRFKDSTLGEESKFLRANAMIKMGFQEQGFALLREVISRSHKSPAALQAGMFIALKKHQSGDTLGAFEQFMWLAQNHANHRLSWVFRMGVAEAIATLKQTPKAVQEYRWVMENAPDSASQVEGAVRIGDLFLERRQYDQAIASYFLAVQEYRDQLNRFPQFWINRAESLYWLGEYDRAAEAFQDVLQRFGSHPAVWRATFRLSEIEGRKGNEKKAQGLLVETINRFPYSAGAVLARARVMACEPSQRPGVDGIQAFFGRELSKFDGEGQVVLERFPDYKGLAHVRALLAEGAEELAIQVALSELDGRSDNPAKGAVARMLEHLFRRTTLQKLGSIPSQESRLAALTYYHDFHARIPHFPGNVDSDYLLKLSQAAIDLGMTSWADEISKRYQSRAGSDRATAMAGPVGVEKNLLESEKAFIAARAAWVSGARDEKSLSETRSLLSKVIEESPYSYERELILSMVESAASRPALALTHVAKAQALAPAEEKRASRVLFLLAKLQAESGNSSAAIETLRELRKAPQSASNQQEASRLVALGLPAAPSAQDLLMLESEQLTRLKRWGEVARLLGSDEYSESLNSSLRYQWALALSKTGKVEDRNKSAEILQTLAQGAPEEFWKNLAREALNNPKVNAKEGRL